MKYPVEDGTITEALKALRSREPAIRADMRARIREQHLVDAAPTLGELDPVTNNEEPSNCGNHDGGARPISWSTTTAPRKTGTEQATRADHAHRDSTRTMNSMKGVWFKPSPLDIDITQVEVKGASSFRELKEMTLTGHIHRIDAGTPLPEGLAVIKDGRDVGGIAPMGHRSIVPTRSMTVEEFTSKLGQIPSKFVTKIKK